MLQTSNYDKLTINMGTSTKFGLQKCHEIRRKTIFHVIMSLKSLRYKKSCMLTCKSLELWGPLFHVFIYPKLLETPRLGHWVALKWNHWLVDACQVLSRLPHMVIAAERSRDPSKTIGLYPTIGSLTKDISWERQLQGLETNVTSSLLHSTWFSCYCIMLDLTSWISYLISSVQHIVNKWKNLKIYKLDC
jgi:hypothetical protein